MSAIIGVKKEMTQLFREDGRVIPCTVIDVSQVRVADVKDGKRDGYEAVVLGFGKKKKTTKAQRVRYKQMRFVPQYTCEFRKDKLAEWKDYAIGDEVKADVLNVGDEVHVTGVTKGKGFQGVMKRWGFKGGPATHGQSDRKRAPGSIGAGTDPGRVFKGKKMPGHMGMRKKTVLNLEVVKVDAENGLLCIKGAIPGSRGSLVKIAKRKR